MLLRKPAALAAFLLICMISFQNCDRISPQMAFLQGEKLSNQESEGGAQPYDGKIFVLLGDPCPDQTRVHAKIILNSESSASLVREKCQNINPINLGSNEFQWTPADPNKLSYQNQPFEIIGTKLDMSLVTPEMGVCYWMTFDFGATADTSPQPQVSKLQLYENGRPLGPAHSLHDDIRNKGLGRFSHWYNTLRFSASDNSNPLTNGRVYTYDILDQIAP